MNQAYLSLDIKLFHFLGIINLFGVYFLIPTKDSLPNDLVLLLQILARERHLATPKNPRHILLRGLPQSPGSRLALSARGLALGLTHAPTMPPFMSSVAPVT